MKLEAVVIPVSDVDRAKEFYGSLGWRLDADFRFDNGFRVVQCTPPGSGAAIQFGSKITTAKPGSADDGCIHRQARGFNRRRRLRQGHQTGPDGVELDRFGACGGKNEIEALDRLPAAAASLFAFTSKGVRTSRSEFWRWLIRPGDDTEFRTCVDRISVEQLRSSTS